MVVVINVYIVIGGKYMKYYEGYDVKQEVWLIKRAYFSGVEPSVVKGKIIYRGTKKNKSLC